jgi:hypothetical protein
MIGAIILAGAIFLNTFGIIGEPIFSNTTAIVLGGSIIIFP